MSTLPLRPIAPDVCVAPQLGPAAMAEAAQAGFKSVVNNRPDFEHGPDQPTSAQLEVQKDRIEGAEMKHRLLHAPGDFLRKFFIQLVTFWYIVETPMKSLLVGAIALIVLGLALLGLRYERRQEVITWPIVALVVYLNVVYAVSLAFARYSMPLYPTLLVLSAAGIASLIPRFFFRISSAPRHHPLEVVAHQHSAQSGLS